MIDNLMWFVSVAAVVGVILNIKKMRACFFVWFITNSLWCIYDLWIGAYAQAALFFVYVCLAMWGIYEWGRESK